MDVNRLDEMIPLSKVDTDCNSNQKGNDHLLYGDYAIVAGTRGIGLIDITDPLRLKIIKKISELDCGGLM